MRSLAIYCLFFCLFLLQGFHRATAASYQYSPCNSSIHSKYKSGFENYPNLPSLVYELQDDMADDDDDDFDCARKKASFTDQSPINNTFLLGHFASLQNNARFYKNFYHLFPDKYIFQRVLRV